MRPIERGHTNWDVNEPNGRTFMHCMIMYAPANFKWHDATCTDHHNFICELDL